MDVGHLTLSGLEGTLLAFALAMISSLATAFFLNSKYVSNKECEIIQSKCSESKMNKLNCNVERLVHLDDRMDEYGKLIFLIMDKLEIPIESQIKLVGSSRKSDKRIEND